MNPNVIFFQGSIFGLIFHGFEIDSRILVDHIFKNCGVISKFFRVALSHVTLSSYYEMNFALMQHHKYSLTELENMIPWERDIYVELLRQHLEEEKKKIEEQRQRRR